MTLGRRPHGDPFVRRPAPPARSPARPSTKRGDKCHIICRDDEQVSSRTSLDHIAEVVARDQIVALAYRPASCPLQPTRSSVQTPPANRFTRSSVRSSLRPAGLLAITHSSGSPIAQHNRKHTVHYNDNYVVSGDVNCVEVDMATHHTRRVSLAAGRLSAAARCGVGSRSTEHTHRRIGSDAKCPRLRRETPSPFSVPFRRR